jgi:hypothetical protein
MIYVKDYFLYSLYLPETNETNETNETMVKLSASGLTFKEVNDALISRVSYMTGFEIEKINHVMAACGQNFYQIDLPDSTIKLLIVNVHEISVPFVKLRRTVMDVRIPKSMVSEIYQ